MSRIVKPAVIYFLLVFVVGFAFGIVRELWVKGMIGARAAEIAEVPLMIGVSALAAISVVRRFGLRRERWTRLAVGLLALVLMLATELTMIVGWRGLTLVQYLESRDPVSFKAYLVGLLFFALMPMLVRGSRRAGRYRY